ncbi:MAG: aldehyde dehydrogenase family protein, partial [Solirubrobacterales bacterium]
MAEPATGLLIGGERVGGEGEVIRVENPYSEAIIAEIRSASPEQVDAAVAAARNGFRVWEFTPATERAEMLHEVASRLRSQTDDLAALMTSEGGKPLLENADEVGWVAAA